MVDFGFYHTTQGNTLCFACGFTIGNWELNSDPLKVKHPNCYWYRNIFNSKNDSFSTRETITLKLESFKNGWAGTGSIDAISVCILF